MRCSERGWRAEDGAEREGGLFTDPGEVAEAHGGGLGVVAIRFD